MTRPDPYDRYHEDMATTEGMREPPHDDRPQPADGPAPREDSSGEAG